MSGNEERWDQRAQSWMGARLGAVMSPQIFRGCVATLARQRPAAVLHTLLVEFLTPLKHQRCLDNLPMDLPAAAGLQFEHLAGLFASTALDHGVIGLTIRQAAYLFGLIRQLSAGKVIEIGRFKGGSTLVIAAAMGGKGTFWSIDNHRKEVGPDWGGDGVRDYDEQLADWLRQHHLHATLLVGDSKTLALDTDGPVDLVFIDGDHSYAGVKSDFDRFGRRVRVGGAVLLDDAFDDDLFKTSSHTVGRLVQEVAAGPEFRLVKQVNRMAHVERVRDADDPR